MQSAPICDVTLNTQLQVILYSCPTAHTPGTQYRTCTFRHLRDLEVVPHPFWHLKDLEVVPHPSGEMLSSMNSSNKQRNRKWEKTPKPKIRLVIYIFSFFTKSLIWSYGRYTHSGIRVRPKTRNKYMFAKRPISLKNSSLKLKAWFFKKVEIWCKYVNIG